MLKNTVSKVSPLYQVPILSIGILLGRVSGFIREWLIALYFGVSEQSDLIVLSVSFSEFFSAFLSSSAIGLVLFTTLRDCQGSQWRAFHRVQLVSLCGGIFVLLGCIPLLLSFLSTNTRWTVVGAVILTIVPNLLTNSKHAAFQYKGQFHRAATSSLVFNLAIIGGVILYPAPVVLALLVIPVASWIRLIACSSPSIKELLVGDGGTKTTVNGAQEVNLRPIATNLLVAVFSGIPWIVIPLLDRLAADRMTAGAVSLLSYAEKIYLFPVTLVLTILPFIYAPEIVKESACLDRSSFVISQRRRVVGSIVQGCIVASGTVLLAPYLVAVALLMTGIADEDLELISVLVRSYAGAIIFSAPCMILSNVLFARNQLKALVVISSLVIASKVLFVVWVERWGLPLFYLPLSSSLSFLLLFVLFCVASLRGMSSCVYEATSLR